MIGRTVANARSGPLERRLYTWKNKIVELSQERQAGAELTEKFLKPDQRALNGIAHVADGFKNTFPLAGFALREGYLEGRLWIALHYRPGPGIYKGEIGFCALISSKCDSSDAAASRVSGFVYNTQIIDMEMCGRGQEHRVFVGDVEPMQLVQSKLPAFVRLQLVQDEVTDCGRGGNSLLFMSVDGTFKRLPIPTKGESGVVADLTARFARQNVVCVIEGGPEIVECIAQNGGRVSWEACADDGSALFPRALLTLGPRSLHICTDVSLENTFQLFDVMFGPFYL